MFLFYFVVKKLLEDGVDVCGTDDKKRSPLHLAAAKGNGEIGKGYSTFIFPWGPTPHLRGVHSKYAMIVKYFC